MEEFRGLLLVPIMPAMVEQAMVAVAVAVPTLALTPALLTQVTVVLVSLSSGCLAYYSTALLSWQVM